MALSGGRPLLRWMTCCIASLVQIRAISTGRVRQKVVTPLLVFPIASPAKVAAAPSSSYADDAKLCADKGVDQGEVKQALRAFEEGELSATAAMRACGLLPKSDSSTNRVFLVRDSKEVARRLLDAAGPDRAAEIVAALTELLTQ